MIYFPLCIKQNICVVNNFQAESQYQKDFKWQPEYLKFAPKYLNEDDMNYAGVSSAKLGLFLLNTKYKHIR